MNYLSLIQAIDRFG